MHLEMRAPGKGELYGIIAFAGTGLASMLSFAFVSRINGEAWQITVCFILAGLFIISGVVSSHIVDGRPLKVSVIYTLIQAVLGISAVYVSPIKGFVSIMLLPLASQAVFMFDRRSAILVGLALWIITAGAFLGPYGWGSFRAALLSFSPAYLFTVLFSFATRDALRAREHAIGLRDDLEAANQQLREHAEQAEELATIRERNRLAREIHDGVGHYLTVINVQVEAARALLKSEPQKSADALDKAARLSREALADVRRSVGSLRTDEQNAPLVESLRSLIADANLPVKFSMDGTPRPLPTATEHALFRATQEGLTNIRAC